jgi:hypothetical protein
VYNAAANIEHNADAITWRQVGADAQSAAIASSASYIQLNKIFKLHPSRKQRTVRTVWQRVNRPYAHYMLQTALNGRSRRQLLGYSSKLCFTLHCIVFTKLPEAFMQSKKSSEGGACLASSEPQGKMQEVSLLP